MAYHALKENHSESIWLITLYKVKLVLWANTFRKLLSPLRLFAVESTWVDKPTGDDFFAYDLS